MTEAPRPERPTTMVPMLAALALFLVLVGVVVVTNLGREAPEGMPPLPGTVEGGWTLTTDADATSGTYEGPDGDPVVQVAWEETSVKEQIEGREFEASGEWACLPAADDVDAVCWADFRGGAVAVFHGELPIPATVRFGEQFLFYWR